MRLLIGIIFYFSLVSLAGPLEERLFQAVSFNDPVGVRKALDAGANPDFRGHDGKNALNIASENGFDQICGILMRYMKDFDVQEKPGVIQRQLRYGVRISEISHLGAVTRDYFITDDYVISQIVKLYNQLLFSEEELFDPLKYHRKGDYFVVYPENLDSLRCFTLYRKMALQTSFENTVFAYDTDRIYKLLSDIAESRREKSF